MTRIPHKCLGFLLALVSVGSVAQTAVASPWRDASGSDVQSVGRPAIQPVKSRYLLLDRAKLEALLAVAPAETAPLSERPLLNLPLPDGTSVNLRIHTTALMPPGLASRHPQIRTFAGVAEGGAFVTARFDLGPRGLNGQVRTRTQQFYIEPFNRSSDSVHQVYDVLQVQSRGFSQNAIARASDEAIAQVNAEAPVRAALSKEPIGKTRAYRGGLRTYRLAIATTAEYARLHDPDHSPPDKTLVLGEIVKLINRVTASFERDAGIRFQLVEREDDLVFTDPNTDPYDNGSINSLFKANTDVLDALLGQQAYDIGHVLSTTRGGSAFPGACDGNKGQSASGSPTPWIDLYQVSNVAHEFGHQFRASHTYSGTSSRCPIWADGPEPGSGVTLMSYAGGCGAEDDIYAGDAIEYFHTLSVDEIMDYSRNGVGSTCGMPSRTGNRQVRAYAGIGGFTIPKQTPFELSGVGWPTGDPMLSVQWEQIDVGVSAPLQQPLANSPLFRSFEPTTSPTRVFPMAAHLVDNVPSSGELLPAVSRELNFRFNVRDNTVGPAYAGFASADLWFKVTDTAGPFRLVAPNGGGQFGAGSKLLVQWDVASTDKAPVSCAKVDVALSQDGGFTFPTVLGSNVENTGTATVTLPTMAISKARIKIKCRSNVFFDISDADFAIR